MITIQAKKHDNLSVEFKFGFEVGGEDVDINDFAVNVWLFVPNSLGINSETYGKDQFYRDIKSNLRLITPVFSLEELSGGTSLPFSYLKESVAKAASGAGGGEYYEYHLKMFAAIFKSALKKEMALVRQIRNPHQMEETVSGLCGNVSGILSLYRSFRPQSELMPPYERVRYCAVDEYLSYLVQLQLMRIVKLIDSQKAGDCGDVRAGILAAIASEEEYMRQNGYATFSKDAVNNREVVYRHALLKKYIESDLYIGLDKKRDGVAVEQIYYSIAAGVAMIFATSVAWATQVRYGNITLPLFIVLVISYMMKDRIKELMRFYFAHKLGNKYFDKKAPINIGIHKVGEMKEGVDFISGGKIDPRVMEMREDGTFMNEESNVLEEKVLLYRKHCVIDHRGLSSEMQYPFRGVNEIMRLHLTRFMQKMDNPEMTVDIAEGDGSISSLKAQRVYHINVVLQLIHRSQSEYRHFRITMNRNGVIKVDEM
ncbi:MAG: hypothetical protein ACI4AE_06600 [Candidatus Cryptobacteroides sp.]